MNRNPKTFGGSSSTTRALTPQQHRATPPPPPPQLAVVELTPSHKRGNLRAFAAVKFGKWMTVRAWRIIQEPGQAPWASGPMQERQQPDGASKFFPILDLPENWQKAAHAVILEAWATYECDGILPGCRVIGGAR